MEANPYDDRIKYVRGLRRSRSPWKGEVLVSAAKFLDDEYKENKRTIRWEYLNDSQREAKTFKIKINAKELGVLISFWMKCGNIHYWKGTNV